MPGADQLAERLKKILPPGIADDDEDQDDKEAQAKKAAQQQALELQQQDIQLETGLKQAKIENMNADTANKKATSVKNLTEAQQNDFENAVQTAELAASSGNPQLMQAALVEITSLMGNAAQPVQNAGMPALTSGER